MSSTAISSLVSLSLGLEQASLGPVPVHVHLGQVDGVLGQAVLLVQGHEPILQGSLDGILPGPDMRTWGTDKFVIEVGPCQLLDQECHPTSGVTLSTEHPDLIPAQSGLQVDLFSSRWSYSECQWLSFGNQHRSLVLAP